MLSVLQKRKKELRTELMQIERQIYDLETSYLEETKEFGNIFSGWDAYLSADKVKAKKQVQNEDRHFSLSSVTSPASRKEEAKKPGKLPDATTPMKKKAKKSKSGQEDSLEPNEPDGVADAPAASEG